MNYKNGSLVGYGYARFTTEYLDNLIGKMGQDYVDNLINLVVAEDLDGVSMDEVLRVLVPNGVAYVKKNGDWTKTPPLNALKLSKEKATPQPNGKQRSV